MTFLLIKFLKSKFCLFFYFCKASVKPFKMIIRFIDFLDAHSLLLGKCKHLIYLGMQNISITVIHVLSHKLK